ncbi:MAG: Mur ligase family protein, partial [Chloroflexota bacterium]
MTTALPTNPLEQYQWLENRLHSLIGPVKFSSEINLRLERMTHLLSLIDNPHHAFRGIHVGGTSGKGSTSTMIATILEEAGYTVGLHTSPHLQILNERHRVNGKLVPTSLLCEAYAEMLPAVEEVKASSKFGAPSYFEAQVALSFYVFRKMGVEFGVIEVGLGGERDATNVLPAEIAVLTNVGLDHTEILGETVVEIAKDKVGIIKEGQTVVTGVHQPDVFRVVMRRCALVDAEMWMIGRDFD